MLAVRSLVPENRVGATKPEPETVPPEMEDTPPAGRARREIPDSPDIDSSGETGKTPSGPILQDRPGPGPEMESTACPPVPPLSSNSPPLQIGHNSETTQTNRLFNCINRALYKISGACDSDSFKQMRHLAWITECVYIS